MAWVLAFFICAFGMCLDYIDLINNYAKRMPLTYMLGPWQWLKDFGSFEQWPKTWWDVSPKF